MTSKLKHILVTGLYDGRAPKFYSSPEAERKDKSKKAFDKITQTELNLLDRFGCPVTTALSKETFLMRLKWYGKDIAEKEHAGGIVKLLRSYENEAKQELEKIQKVIRDWENRFPSVVQDPSAFEVVATIKEEQEEKENILSPFTQTNWRYTNREPA